MTNPNAVKVHRVKSWPPSFDAMRRGSKTFDVRKDDRNYRVGDELQLEEWNPGTESFTGRVLRRLITFKMGGPDAEQFGVSPGFCVLAIGPTSAGSAS